MEITTEVAIMKSEMKNLQEEIHEIKTRVDSLDSRVVDLEIQDQRLVTSIEHHISHEDERWIQSEKS